MRPLSLTVEGLTAFRDSQTVDLEGLDLFVITGPTGAGKSSILDAMTLALYGKICRAEHADLKDLISHNKAAATVQLEFSVDGNRYRVARRLPRKGLAAATVERLSDGEFVLDVESPGVKAINAKIQQLLGLDFDAFTKAVLLPQGRFHEFLSGDAATRRTILSRLLDLERYLRMGAEARAKARDLSRALEERGRRIAEDYADATPAHLDEASGRSHEIAEQARSLHDAERLVGRGVEEWSREHTKQETVIQHKDTLDAWVGTTLPELADSWAATQGRRQKATADLESAGRSLERAEDKRREIETSLMKAEQRWGDEAALLTLKQAAETVEAETAQLAAQQDRLRQEQARRDDLVAALDTLESAREEAESELHRLEEEQERLSQERQTATIALELAEALETLAQAEQALNAAGTEWRKSSNRRRRSEEALEQLRVGHAALDLRRHLHSGQPCPVCEQMVATVPEGASGDAARLEEARRELDAASHAERQAHEVASRAEERRDAAASHVDSARARVPPGFEPPRAPEARSLLEKSRVALEAGNRLLEQANATLREAQKASDLASADAKTVQERCHMLEEQATELQRRIAEARKRLEPAFGSEPPSDVADRIEAQLNELRGLRGSLAAATTRREEARAAREQSRDALDHIVGEGADVERHLAEIRGASLRVLEGLAVAVGSDAALPPPSQGNVDDDLSSLQSACANAIKVAEGALTEIAEGLERLRSQAVQLAQGVGLDVEGLTVEDIAERLRRAADQARREADETAHEVDRLRERIARRQEIEASMAADGARRDLYHRLALELQADHFVAYVLRESMTSLAAQATVELKALTDGRYSIRPRETNFEVVDHYNADERRSVSTLSGGETFLASLALALALSGSVRDLAGNAAAARLESMFIDEGFGALDGETLETAVDALERLSGDGRMIGVISHVGMLGDRIEAGLDVRKSAGSSTITRRDQAAA